MLRRGSKKNGSNADYSGFWIPYSDLMAAFVGVFALILVVEMLRIQQARDSKELQERREFSEQLRETFSDDSRIEISDKGALRLREMVLFEQGQDSLTTKGQETLLSVIPRVLDLVKSRPDFKSQLRRIIVEGHADSTYSGPEANRYLFNLALSQRRATNVTMFVMSADSLMPYRQFMQGYIMASGRSYTDMIIDEVSGKPDLLRSRRIEISFLMNDEKIIRDLYEQLYASEAQQR